MTIKRPMQFLSRTGFRPVPASGGGGYRGVVVGMPSPQSVTNGDQLAFNKVLSGDPTMNVGNCLVVPAGVTLVRLFVVLQVNGGTAETMMASLDGGDLVIAYSSPLAATAPNGTTLSTTAIPTKGGDEFCVYIIGSGTVTIGSGFSRFEMQILG